MELEIPDHPLLRELRGYAEIGYRRGVREVLEQLEGVESVQPELLSNLEQMADGMQFARLADYLGRRK